MLSLSRDEPLDELTRWIYRSIHECIRPIWGWVLDIGGVGVPDTSIVGGVHDGMLVLVLASYATVVVAGGVIVMTHETLQTRYSVKEIAPRLVVGIGLAWFSQLILTGATGITGDVVDALIDVDEGELSHGALDVDSSSTLATVMYDLSANAGVTDMSLLALLSVVLMLVAAIVLLVSAVMRWLAMLAVVASAPLALACHGLPHTDAAARLWWRMLIACAASSIGQAGCLFLWRYIAWDESGQPRGELDYYTSDDLDGYYLGVVYMLITVWAMWKVHNAAFAWARGRAVRIPGARMVAGIVAWRAFNKTGPSRRRTTSPPAGGRDTARTSAAHGGGLSRWRWSHNWKNPDGTTRSVRVRRPRVDVAAAKRARTKAGRPLAPKRFARTRPAPLVVDRATPATSSRTGARSRRLGAAVTRTIPATAPPRQAFPQERFGSVALPRTDRERQVRRPDPKRFARAQREIHATRRPRKPRPGGSS